MKTLFTTFLTLALVVGSPMVDLNKEKVEMMLQADDLLKDKVRIFDYDGNLLKEMEAEDVAYDDISISDYLTLESSDFAFKYLGDYYYLRDLN